MLGKVAMLYVNPHVARPDPRRPHARPLLRAGQSLYVPASELPPIAADGRRGTLSEADWRELRDSIGGTGQPGTTWNLTG